MALGLLAGAMAGGGEAVQDNARSRIEELREMRLGDIDRRYQTSEREASQEFQSSEREAGQEFTTQERIGGQEFTAGENQANRQHQTGIAGMRESGADRRAQQGAWELVPTEGGGMARYNRATGEMEAAPGGLLHPDGPAASGEDEDLSRTDITTLISQVTSERDEELERLRRSNPSADRQELLNALSHYDERITELRRRLPGGSAAFGGNEPSAGGSYDWSRFLD